MKNNCITLLCLEGALQSWGEHSKFDYRDSARFPSKSGIVGLIGCAMGIERGSVELEKISKNIRIAVRCDNPGKMSVDFHTVTAERYIINAKGEDRTQSGGGKCRTIITYRTYLQDASYLVAIQTNLDLATKIEQAFRNPCWPIYLGRKSCVPSIPVYQGIREEYNTLEEAMKQCPILSPRFRKEEKSPNCVYEIESTDGSGYERMDELQNAVCRSFVSRRVTLKKKGEEDVLKQVQN